MVSAVSVAASLNKGLVLGGFVSGETPRADDVRGSRTQRHRSHAKGEACPTKSALMIVISALVVLSSLRLLFPLSTSTHVHHHHHHHHQRHHHHHHHQYCCVYQNDDDPGPDLKLFTVRTDGHDVNQCYRVGTANLATVITMTMAMPSTE